MSEVTPTPLTLPQVIASALKRSGSSYSNVMVAVGRYFPLATATEIAAALRQIGTISAEIDPDTWRELFCTYKELIETPEPEPVIEGIVNTGEIVIDGALPKHGKTWWELAKMKALLSGDPLLGRFKVRKKAKRTVYMVPEAGIAQVKRRLVLMRLMEYVNPECEEGQRLFVMPRRMPLLTNLGDARILKAAEGADVFLDTLVRFIEGDESKAADVKQFSELCLSLATIARTVTIAHHAPKAFGEARTMTLENMLRGSGDIGAMLSNAFGLRQIDKETNRIHVSCLAARDDESYLEDFQIEGRPHINQSGNFKLTAQPGTAGKLDDHLPRKGGRPEDPEKREKLKLLLELRRENPGTGVESLVELLASKHQKELTESTARRWLDKHDEENADKILAEQPNLL